MNQFDKEIRKHINKKYLQVDEANKRICKGDYC